VRFAKLGAQLHCVGVYEKSSGLWAQDPVFDDGRQLTTARNGPFLFERATIGQSCEGAAAGRVKNALGR